jgi:hypothetical protein
MDEAKTARRPGAELLEIYGGLAREKPACADMMLKSVERSVAEP